MQVSKTTINFAKKRGMTLTAWEADLDTAPPEPAMLWIFLTDTDIDDSVMEPDIIYTMDNEGFHYKGNIGVTADVLEALPAHLPDETALRGVLKKLSTINR